MPFVDRLPGITVPCLNAIVLDMLSIVEPFHGQRMIEDNRRVEYNFKCGMMRTCWRRPESCRITVQRRFRTIRCVSAPEHKILAVTLTNRFGEFPEPLHVRFRNQPTPVRRE